MLPGFLVSTYKKYKQDTSILVEWLSENAKKCGYKLPTVTNTAKSVEAPTVAPRLKGKARKLAKQTSNGTTAASSVSKDASQPRHLISTKDLLAQTNAIVDSKAVIEVPIAIIQAGLRAVSARKRCAAYFRKTSDEDSTSQSNTGHSYFIRLMEDVLLALQSRFVMSSGSAKEDSQSEDALKSASDLLEGWESRFAALDVEESTENLDEETPSAPAKPIYELAPETKADTNEEKLFAMFCLFDDLARLRKFLLDLWTDYLLEKNDLIATAVTTNTAFQLAIRTQDEVLAMYPDCGDYQNVLSTILAVLEDKQSISEDEIEFELDGAVVDWIYGPAHSMLDSFCDVLQPGQVPLMKRGHFGVYNPRADRNKMDDAQRNHQDLILLMELLPEFCFLAKYKIDLFATDELTRGLSKMALTKEIPVWLTFATTVLLDIQHLARDKVDHSLKQLQVIASRAKGTLSHYFDFSRAITRPSTWPKDNELWLKHLAEGIDKTMLNDVVLSLKQKFFTQFGHSFSADTERFYLYKRQPILCGLLAFRLTLEMQYLGVSLVQAWGTAIYPAHFYNALCQQTQPAPWPLMDEVIALHGEDRVFVGGRPTTILDCYKQVSLVLGYSVEQFAKNRRSKKTVVSKNGPRGLKVSSPLGEIFRHGLASDGSMAFTMHNVEELLNEQALDAAPGSNPQSKSLRREWTRSHRLTSLQFLEALKTSIPVELPKLQFDYFRLHEQSITLLRRLRDALDADLKKFVGGAYIENESQLPFVSMYIIMVACGTDRVAEQVGISNAGSRMLQKASEVFDSFITEQV